MLKLSSLCFGLILSASVVSATKHTPIDCSRLLVAEKEALKILVPQLLQTTLKSASDIILRHSQETLGSYHNEMRILAPLPSALYPHLVMGTYLMKYSAFSDGPEFIDLLMARLSLQAKETLGRLPVHIQKIRLYEIETAINETSGRAFHCFFEVLEQRVEDKVWELIATNNPNQLEPLPVVLELLAGRRSEAMQLTRDERKNYMCSNVCINIVETIRMMNNRGQRFTFGGVDFSVLPSWMNSR